MSKSILLINGPNLNLLGTREPEFYGSQSLGDIEKLCVAHARSKGLELDTFQSNHEGAIVDEIQSAASKKYDAVIMNPGAFSHTSIAIRDAITGTGLLVYEVHISNIYARETFRHNSYVSGVAKAVVCGMGVQGYLAAIDAIAVDS